MEISDVSTSDNVTSVADIGGYRKMLRKKAVFGVEFFVVSCRRMSVTEVDATLQKSVRLGLSQWLRGIEKGVRKSAVLDIEK